MYNSKEDSMKDKNIATTFNMSVTLKEKAQIYIAKHNKEIRENGHGSRINLGILLNKALKEYLDRVIG